MPFKYLALRTALFVVWEFRGLWKILLEFRPGFPGNHPPLVFGYAQVTCREKGFARDVLSAVLQPELD